MKNLLHIHPMQDRKNQRGHCNRISRTCDDFDDRNRLRSLSYIPNYIFRKTFLRTLQDTRTSRLDSRFHHLMIIRLPLMWETRD